MYNDKHVSNPIIITSYDNYPTISRNRTLLVLRHHLTCYQQTRGWLEHGRKVTLTLSLSFSIPLPLEILKGERSYTMSLACLALHNARVRVSRSQEGGGDVPNDEEGDSEGEGVSCNYLLGCNTIYIRPDPCLPFPCWQAFYARTKHDEPFIFAHRGPVYTLLRGRRAAACIHEAVARPRATRGKQNRRVKRLIGRLITGESTDRPIFLQKIAWDWVFLWKRERRCEHRGVRFVRAKIGSWRSSVYGLRSRCNVCYRQMYDKFLHKCLK